MPSMDNKKKRNKIIILVVALVMLIATGTVCLANVLGKEEPSAGASNSTEVFVVDDNTEAKTTEVESADKTTEQTATTEEKGTTEKATTESATSAKPKDNDTTSAAAPTTTQTVHTSSGTAPAATESVNQTTTTQATTEKEKVWHEPVIEMVWVVDKEAYTETIPVYETVPAVRCHGCGQIFYSQEDMDAHGDVSAYDSCGGYSSDYQQVQVGTTEVYHEEEGHWEEVVIQEGYWE